MASGRHRRGVEAAETLPERQAEAATDRRGGWRASKAKGTRRNRRYEKRLLAGVEWHKEDGAMMWTGAGYRHHWHCLLILTLVVLWCIWITRKHLTRQR